MQEHPTHSRSTRVNEDAGVEIGLPNHYAIQWTIVGVQPTFRTLNCHILGIAIAGLTGKATHSKISSTFKIIWGKLRGKKE